MTAEEFFRKKIKEKYQHQEVITLANNLITAEDGMRWAYEFSQLPQLEICINCDEQKETHEICMDCIGKLIKENQQEISDEEIEKEIKSRYETPHYNSGFMDCAKWYREQLKQRQNKNIS